MRKIPVTASNRQSKGKPLCGKDGKAITRELLAPEKRSEIPAAFGSFSAMVKLALKQKKIEKQNEIRVQWENVNFGTGSAVDGGDELDVDLEDDSE